MCIMAESKDGKDPTTGYNSDAIFGDAFAERRAEAAKGLRTLQGANVVLAAAVRVLIETGTPEQMALLVKDAGFTVSPDNLAVAGAIGKAQANDLGAQAENLERWAELYAGPPPLPHDPASPQGSDFQGLSLGELPHDTAS